jgi:hypothetical protein
MEHPLIGSLDDQTLEELGAKSTNWAKNWALLLAQEMVICAIKYAWPWKTIKTCIKPGCKRVIKRLKATPTLTTRSTYNER